MDYFCKQICHKDFQKYPNLVTLVFVILAVLLMSPCTFQNVIFDIALKLFHLLSKKYLICFFKIKCQSISLTWVLRENVHDRMDFILNLTWLEYLPNMFKKSQKRRNFGKPGLIGFNCCIVTEFERMTLIEVRKVLIWSSMPHQVCIQIKI